MKRLGRFVIKGLCGFFLIFLILDGGPMLLSSSVKEIRQKTENIKMTEKIYDILKIRRR